MKQRDPRLFNEERLTVAALPRAHFLELRPILDRNVSPLGESLKQSRIGFHSAVT
jgi:hypothetical protein